MQEFQTTKHIMSMENPTGTPLDVLCDELIEDIKIRDQKLRQEVPQEARIKRYNALMITHLELCAMYQREVMRKLSIIGPNEGPLGNPRIGVQREQNDGGE